MNTNGAVSFDQAYTLLGSLGINGQTGAFIAPFLQDIAPSQIDLLKMPASYNAISMIWTDRWTEGNGCIDGYVGGVLPYGATDPTATDTFQLRMYDEGNGDSRLSSDMG